LIDRLKHHSLALGATFRAPSFKHQAPSTKLDKLQAVGYNRTINRKEQASMKDKPYFNEDIFLYLLYKKSKKKYYQYLKNGKKIKRITKKGERT
jgi:hypothetical protein